MLLLGFVTGGVAATLVVVVVRRDLISVGADNLGDVATALPLLLT